MRPMAPAIRPTSAPPVTRFGSAPKAASTCRPQTKRRPFSEDEIAYIRKHLGTMPVTHIAEALLRHPSSIDYISRKLGLMPPKAPRKRDEAKERERQERLEQLRQSLIRICRLAGIPTEGISSETLASTLIGISAWQPPNIHVAAELGHDEWFTPRPASRPTRTKPGSKARVAAYAARVETGEDIWHPGDSRPT